MTSYRKPDYDVELRMLLSDFQAIAGIAFDVSVVVYDQNERQVSGMVIIPEGNEFSESNPVATAWLWSEDYIGMHAGTRVCITFGKTCDPMLKMEKYSIMVKYNGLTLEGRIKKNWNIK